METRKRKTKRWKEEEKKDGAKDRSENEEKESMEGGGGGGARWTGGGGGRKHLRKAFLTLFLVRNRDRHEGGKQRPGNEGRGGAEGGKLWAASKGRTDVLGSVAMSGLSRDL